MRAFSYGGGVQSTAALVLAAQGKIETSWFLFADVGADSENPETIKYVQDIAIPYAKQHNIELDITEKRRRDGTPVTIYGNILSDKKSVGIPIYMSNGAPGNRSCTIDFKIKVIERFMKRRGIAYPIGLGISTDEWQRARVNDPDKWYPLLDLRLSRMDCIKVIQDEGLPVPPKSSCWFCPFHSLRTWQEMRNTQPEQFKKAVELESIINKRRAELGKDHVWLSRKLKPLDKATTELVQGFLLEDEDNCESGYCML